MDKLDSFIHQAVTAMPISGTSLIASLYGDCLSPLYYQRFGGLPDA